MNRSLVRGRKRRAFTIALLSVLSLSSQSSAALVISKADNSNNLDQPTSWNGAVVPGAADTAVWDSNVTSANSVVLGSNLSLGGINVTNPGGAVTIGAGNTLTVGTGGINMSAATQSLIISSGLTLTGGQTWNVATGQSLTTSAFTRSGAGTTLTVDRSVNTGTITASPALTNGVVPWAIIKSAGTAANNSANGYTFATVSGGNLTAYLAATAVTTSYPANNAAVNYDWSSSGTQGAIGSSRSANTIRYTGTGVTQQTNSTQTETFNALMNAGTGAVNLGGGAQIMNIQSATGELVLAAMTSDININGRIINNGATAGAVTVLGEANRNVNLTGANTYTGATFINGGTLLVSGAGAINSTSSIAVNGVGAKYLHTSSVASTRNIALTRGSVDGTGTVGAVTVADNAANVIANGNLAGTGTLTVSSLAFGGDATMNLRLGAGVGVNVTGALSTTPASGTVTINADKTGWVIGSNNLVGFGSFAGSVSDLTLGSITGLGARQSAGSLAVSGNFITLGVNGDLPVWTGASGSAWTTATTGDNTGPNNWATKTGFTGTNFWSADTPEFNDTYDVGGGPVAVSNRTIDIQGANVTPGVVTFNNSTGDYTLSSTGGFGIAGTASLVKSGTSGLIISNANLYSGGTTINSGTIDLQNASAIGTGSLNINGGSLANSSGSAVTLSTNNAQNWNGDVSFSGPNNLSMGTGLVTLTGGDRTLTLGGGSTLGTGRISSTTGGLSLTGNGSLAITTAAASSISGGLSVGANTTLQFNTGTTSGTTGDFIASGLTGSGTVSNGGSVERWLIVNGTSDSSFGGQLQNGGTGSLGLLKQGAGTLTLSGTNNTMSGAVNINNGGMLEVTGSLANAISYTIGGNNGTAGVLRVNSATANALGSNAVNFDAFGNSSTARLELSGSSLANSVSLAGRNNTSVAIQNLSGSSSISGTISLNAGGSTYNIQSDAGVLNLSNITVGGGNRVLTLLGDGDGNIGGVISNGAGTLGIAKTGNGAWTFSNANTYTGATTISAGDLYVNGSTASGSAVTLNGGTLGGSGVVGGSVTVNGGATLSPGNSIESLGVGSVSFATASTFEYELDTATLNGDLLFTTGNLDIASGSILTVTELFSGSVVLGDKLTLISYGGTWNSGLFEYLGKTLADDSSFVLGSNSWLVNYNDTAGGTNFTGDQVAGVGFLTITAVAAVPEPSAALALGWTVACLSLLRRRARP